MTSPPNDIGAGPFRLRDHDCPPHRLYFRLAGVTVEVATPAPIPESHLPEATISFRTETPGEDVVRLCHRVLDRPAPLAEHSPGSQVYVDLRMRVFQHGDEWLYFSTPNPEPDTGLPRWPVQGLAVFNAKHTHGVISYPSEAVSKGMLSLSVFTADQLFMTRLMADRRGVIFHSASAVLGGQGFLFLGHTGAGKSTISQMLVSAGEVLCDERNIVRLWNDGFHLHGTWHHGTFATVSPREVPLSALFFLEQSPTNAIVPVEDRHAVLRRLPFYAVKPVMTADWVGKTLETLGDLAWRVPAYRLLFDRTGAIIDELARFRPPAPAVRPR